MDKDTLTSQYGRAGIDFLAVKLMAMFRRIETQEDIARHNVILHDVLTMLGEDENRLKFYQVLAGALVNRPPVVKEQRFRWCRMVAKRIMTVGKK